MKEEGHQADSSTLPCLSKSMAIPFCHTACFRLEVYLASHAPDPEHLPNCALPQISGVLPADCWIGLLDPAIAGFMFRVWSDCGVPSLPRLCFMAFCALPVKLRGGKITKKPKSLRSSLSSTPRPEKSRSPEPEPLHPETQTLVSSKFTHLHGA